MWTQCGHNVVDKWIVQGKLFRVRLQVIDKIYLMERLWADKKSVVCRQR